ncbi:MAG: phosphatidylglycerophosphatase A [Candidatus Aminicenantes bacterium]|nr:phosphatidylglycerophosphatase A [Candidatus Aminicenantes bacterium]HHF52638.1 phosphatidylglycerophosphatase A [Candidatus Aminicenantes bacterium]
MKFFSKMISSFFGIGFFPVAPGTLASLITILIYKYVLYQLKWPFMLSLFLVIYLLGVAASSKYVSISGKHDPGEVVIDEVLGQLVALFLLRPSWIMVLSAFFLFRFFDIIKPLFIKKAEKFSKGWGIMLDDIVAGIYTSIILNIVILLA